MDGSPTAAEPTATLRLTWKRGDTRYLLWLDGLCAAGMAIAAVVGVADDRPGGFALLAIALLPGYVAMQAWAALRTAEPALTLLPDRSIVLTHPLMRGTLTIPIGDVHSLWLGPFPQAEPDRRSRWVGKRWWPSDVVDASQGLRADSPTILIVFSSEVGLMPPLVISPSVWALHRQSTPLWRRKARGIEAAVVDRAEDERFATATRRTLPEMPEDVRSWLA
jgi:hypothetical protein